MKQKSWRIFQQRSRMDIIACILKHSCPRSRKTRIIYGCNLSFSQFNQYKDYLIETGFLKVSKLGDGTEIYQITDKGKEFLKDYEKIKNMLESRLV